ncbi:U2 snRNP complex subunit IST3 KNAG_0E03510 [Huiozyma naganishii CBS 8797]|uniref:RRM domain-containing protein n=1 Tax=Huiozyma naganishii (strain ATCC MYA-139 / BCRC 22969 / CBS 8797 / KCTC 17520 / NBRC 10181 / NCYC 3082 / Yp74L-3) TaxID=1071383 RepID=J7RM41_HUIN7|nr:hypothetical protein KNAG_0E03510 [Kazachstania naganishii CBS 8797]CCK70608.1 hypothetical protein KNAG_0E03510 [Kazachstania naganishii CBS 8797]
MRQARAIQKINQAELDSGIISPELSWHDEYRDQAYIFIGGLNKNLTEGDILTVFSQFGVPVDILLVRDRNSGESKGFAYLKYEDQRSTILAVDNMNGVKIAGRMVQVDHTLFEPKADHTVYKDAVDAELKKDFVKETAASTEPKMHQIKELSSGQDNQVDDDLADPMASFGK